MEIQDKKRRGRPRKTNKIDIIKNEIKNENSLKNEDEIILYIPYFIKELQEGSNESDKLDDDKKIKLDKDGAYNYSKLYKPPGHGLNIFTVEDANIYSDNESNSDDIINKEVEILMKTIESLKDELKNYQEIEILKKDENLYAIDMKIDFLDTRTGEQIIKNNNGTCCWWCTEPFDGKPFYIPERVIDGVYHVFGFFCGDNCGAAYNFSLNDGKVWERFSLIKKISIEVKIAPPWQCLQKFGGPLCIEAFRKDSLDRNKEYRYILPPMRTIVPVIEKNYRRFFSKKESSIDKNDLILKRTKELPNAKNNLVEAFEFIKKRK
jgi:hypothetical protein